MELTKLADIAAKSSFAAPDKGTASDLAEKNKNIDEYKNATKPTFTADPLRDTTPSPKDRIAPKARYGARPGEKRIDTKEMTKPLGSFEKGTSHVPKTGVYKLHEGEAVIPKEKNMDSKMTDKMTDALGGKDEKAPKKQIKEMVHRKTANGKHIIVHKHHHPAHHPDEEHAMENMAAVHQHMEDHAGTPNEGEGAESAAPAGAAQLTAAPATAGPVGPTSAGM
jgi:hypothetical protein